MKFYLAGPMTGVPQFNYPLFDKVSAQLRAMGLEIVSPAELDDPETRKQALASPDGKLQDGRLNGQTWGDMLARDIKLIADGGIDGIVVLPDWEFSRGARMEVFTAINLGKPVYFLLDDKILRYPYWVLINVLRSRIVPLPGSSKHAIANR